MSGAELADALSASRSRAIAALGKAYVRRTDEPDDELFAGLLHKMGLDDDVAIQFLLASWAILREQKADAPAENGAKPEDTKPSQKQLDYLAKLADERGFPSPIGLTKAQATQAIDELKAGTYDPAKYDVPF